MAFNDAYFATPVVNYPRERVLRLLLPLLNDTNTQCRELPQVRREGPTLDVPDDTKRLLTREECDTCSIHSTNPASSIGTPNTSWFHDKLMVDESAAAIIALWIRRVEQYPVRHLQYARGISIDNAYS